MAYTITLTSAEQYIKETSVQIIMVFTVNDSGSNQNYSFVEKGIRVNKWNALSWNYDFEDLLLLIGNYDITLGDTDGYLDTLFFGNTSEALLTDKQPEITIKINGNIKYIGKVQEDGKTYDEGSKSINLKIDPNTQIINKKNIYNDKNVDEVAVSNAVHSGGVVTITLENDHIDFVVNDSIKIFNVNGMTDLNGYWLIQSVPSSTSITVNLSTAQSYTNGGSVQVLQSNNPFEYQALSYYYLMTILEDIFQLVDSSITYAGGEIEIVHDWLFYGKRDSDNNPLSDIEFTNLYQLIDPLFFDQEKGLSNLGDVLKKLAIDWCGFTGLLHKQKAFFKKLFYYNSSNLQTLGTVRNRIKAHKYGLIDYVKVSTNISTPYFYEKGQQTQIEGRTIIRDVLPGFFDNKTGVVVSASNIKAVIAGRGADDGTYTIYQVKDPNLLSAAFTDNGNLIAEFWYNFRNNIQNCRVDKFFVDGIDYDFLKDFNYDGSKYQTIAMTINISQYMTEIDAIYLGEI